MNENARVHTITEAEARASARAAVAHLAPLTEDEAWVAAQDDPYGLLTHEQRQALETLDSLDYLMSGQIRGCHYGACTGHVIDTSWRSR